MSGIHIFTYEELKPLIDFLAREAYVTEHHYPGFHAIVEKLMKIKEENENDSIESRRAKEND
jgi:hypothetical protein